MTTATAPPRRSRASTVVMGLIGMAVMVAVFAVLFPQMGSYEEAFERLGSIPAPWLAVLALTGIVNILVYPCTAIAAIPDLPYRHAFVDRQVGFLISNAIPGGGAVAVGTQYSILSRYGVSATAAAAAVAADAVWTYLMVLGTPALAVALLVIEGRSAAGYTLAAAVGLAIVIVSVIAIAAVLRSTDTARRIGQRLQRPVTALWHLVRRTPPDVVDRLVEFNEHASTMVGRRWQSLTLANAAAQIAPYLVLVAALAGLGAFPEPLSWVEVFAAYAIALLLTSFPLTPGGLGTVDAVLVLLLRQFGADASDAIAADLIWRLVWFLPQLLAGLGAFGVFSWGQRRRAT